MKKIFLFILFFYSFATAQYEIKCDYLKNPDKIKGYVDSCASFWISSYDTLYGGFFSNVNRSGAPSNNDKNMLTQSRTAYGMVRTFMLTGDTSYLKYAQGALDFMYEHAWDENNGGWFNEMNREGNILANGQYNNSKWSFMQNYALVGIGAMVEATQNTEDWKYYSEGRAAVDSNLWDSRPGYPGYYNSANIDWSNPSGKGFTPTMDGITTHILYYYLITGKNEYKERLIALADNVIDYMLPAMDNFQYGYPEEFDSDWKPVLSNTYVFTGHLLKSAWCLTRAYLIEPKQEYTDFSSTILDEVLAKGYDDQYGGCYKEYDGKTGQRYDDNKEWWELEQMFNAAIMNYYISSDEKYLKAADETLDFYMKYFVDHTYGEVYQTVSRTGSPVTNSKASYWKAGYHSIEFGYYIYLYSNLFLYKKPVTLYYYFQPADSVRNIKLYPLAVEDNVLKISSVNLNGDTYSDYLADQRKLNIPAGTGGVFEVTFDRKAAAGVAENNNLPQNFYLYQNYPNPFNPSTAIEYELNKSGAVKLEVYDITGQKIKTLLNGYKDKGRHKVSWDGYADSGIRATSGVYFFHFVFNNQQQIKKGILLN
jgi:mannose/cellobiose epimerase-like protein (N-acyl-D-glucosamine 2-epimerase family)